MLFHILTFKNRAAQIIDHFPLLIHHIIVFKKMFADLKIMPLDAPLSAFSIALCQPGMLEDLSFFHPQFVHHTDDFV